MDADSPHHQPPAAATAVPESSTSAARRTSTRRKRSSAPDPDPPPKRIRRSASTSKAKGKKRAQPEPDDDLDEQEQEDGPSSSKKPRYELRARKTATTSTSTPATMPRKKTTARPKKAAPDHPDDDPSAAAAPSSSTQPELADVQMTDDIEQSAQSHHSGDGEDDHSGEESHSDDGDGDGAHDDDDGEPDPDDHDDDEREHDHSAALMFGLGGGGLGSYMLSLGGKLKTILQHIRPAADASTRLVALQELSEILSFGSEEMLSGYFQVDAFVKELVAILGGTQTAPAPAPNGEDEEMDEDAALAAALAASGGGGAFGGGMDDAQLEAQLLACRCLANLMEALPGSAHTVVYHGAVPVLCAKLVEIAYIDLAEQTLSTLEKMSEEYPSAIVREGGLAALLNYLDFFSTQVQRTALQAASNCLRNVSTDSFSMIKDVFPIIRNVLSYSDARCVEYACLCVIRVVESYHRAAPELLEPLLDDPTLIRAINGLLLGAAPPVSPGTYTLLLRALGTAARACASVAMGMMDAEMGETLCQILSGLPAGGADGEVEPEERAVAVMQAVGNRPKEQVEEALGLVCELMPPLPKDGVMDHRAYTEKALAKMVKAKAKAERRANNAAASSSATTAAPVHTPAISANPSAASSSANVNIPPAPSTSTPAAGANPDASADAAQPSGDAAQPAPPPPTPTRAEMLRARPGVALRFMRLLVPVLVDVFSASVMVNVRSKAVNGVLKALCFLDGPEVVGVLKGVPIASWAGGVLRDRPSLVIGALQIVELLLTKAPDAYRPSFRREGVLHEIERIADRPLSSSTVPAPSTAAEAAPAPARAPLDPADAVTLRARVLRAKGLAGGDGDEGDDVLARLRAVVERLKAPEADADAVREVAAIFTGASVSSFECVQSGLVDGLLAFASGGGYDLDVATRRKLLLDALMPGGKSASAFGSLVRRLQESLTRVEAFEVVTVSQGADDARRNSAQMLARQLRLKLVAEEGSDVPRSCANVVVSIHAIATFQALDDYLRPRVAGVVGGGNAARFASMLAALAGRAGPSSRRGQVQPPPPPPQEPEPAAPAPAEPAAGVERRRSLRLQEKMKEDEDLHMDVAEEQAAEPEPEHEPEHEQEQEQHSAVLVPGGDPDEDEIAEDFVDDDFSASQDMFNDGAVDTANGPREPEEKTTNVTVGDDGRDGLSVHAQTPHGTRVATPNPLAAAASSSTPARPSPLARPSYASMLSKKPGAGDWHLEFSMDEHPLPLDMTIYGAIHQHEMRRASAAGTTFQPNTIWQGVYTVKFKKVPGPAVPQAPPEPQDVVMKDRMGTPALASIAEDAPHSKILRLLRVLYKLNAALGDKYFSDRDERPPLPDAAFVNNKLTAKLTRQLEEPMIVASSCLPDWALDLSQHFPFLFPFATRYAFLQSTSFGYARLILKWQAQQSRAQDSRREDAFAFLGRPQRQKVRIYRKHILESAFRVFELYGSSSSILEVEYFEEVGTGLGPTLEFYSMVSRELAGRNLKIWRDADSTVPGVYVHHPLGLFPAPIPGKMDSEAAKKRTQLFGVVGQFIAKALLDSRIIDMSFNKIFMKYVLDEDVPLTIGTLELVDPALAKSLSKLSTFAQAKNAIDADTSMAPAVKAAALADVRVDGYSLEDLALDFTVPGYDIELVENGRNVVVDASNIQQYIDAVLDMLLGSGIAAAVQAFRDGFSKVFPVTDLQIFSADELVMIFGNAEEDWSAETLTEAIKADHGFNVDSRAIRDLISVMSEYDAPTRREFLQFITGSPKLPIGGYRGLNPPFTVVRKPHEPPLSPDDYLPSVMTCVNYLKLPEYSSKAVMAAKLRTAMKEGVGSFHLS